MNKKFLFVVGTILVSAGMASEKYVSQQGTHIQILLPMDEMKNNEKGNNSSKYQAINQPSYSKNIIKNKQKHNLEEDKNITNFPFKVSDTGESLPKISINIPKQETGIISNLVPQLFKTEKQGLKVKKTAKDTIKKNTKKTIKKPNKNSLELKKISRQQHRQNLNGGQFPMASLDQALGMPLQMLFVQGLRPLFTAVPGSPYLHQITPVMPSSGVVGSQQASIPPSQNTEIETNKWQYCCPNCAYPFYGYGMPEQ